MDAGRTGRPRAEEPRLIVVGVLLLPALLIVTWIGTWFVRRSKRWLYYFPAALAAVLVLGAVVVLTPRGPCEATAPAACLDGLTLFGGGNLFTGFVTWLGLLLLTALGELGLHLAYVSRLRRTTGEWDRSPADAGNAVRARYDRLG